MTDNAPQDTTPVAEQPYYEERVVEYVDNRRQRAVHPTVAEEARIVRVVV